MMERSNGVVMWRGVGGRMVFAMLVLVMALVLPGCAGNGGQSEDTGEQPAQSDETTAAAAVFPVTVTDDAGRDVTIESEPQHIVSLAPANTEIVAELDALDRLVGVTTYDDYPPEVTELEKVGDFITPNLEVIASLEPDLILATTGVQGDVLAQLEQLGAPVLAVDPQALEQLYASIETVGAAVGEPERADEVVADMRSGIDFIAQTVGVEPATPCFIEIAQDPLFTAGTGTLLDDLITAAGGRNVVSQEGYVGYSLEQLLQDDPSVYLATKGSMSDPSQLESRAGYDALSAVKAGRVAVLDDNLVSRPGPRVVQGVGQIAVALHPDLFREHE